MAWSDAARQAAAEARKAHAKARSNLPSFRTVKQASSFARGFAVPRVIIKTGTTFSLAHPNTAKKLGYKPVETTYNGGPIRVRRKRR